MSPVSLGRSLALATLVMGVGGCAAVQRQPAFAAADRAALQVHLHAPDDDNAPPADLNTPAVQWLPMHEPSITVPVHVNGVEAEAVLDTGAMTCTVPADQVNRLGITLQNQMFAGGYASKTIKNAIGDQVEVYKGTIAHLKIGDIDFTDIPVVVEPSLPAAKAVPILIGWSVLRQLDLIGVPERSLLGVAAAGTAPVLSGDKRRIDVHTVSQGRRLLVNATALAGDQASSIAFTLDTGASRTQVRGTVKGLVTDPKLALHVSAFGGDDVVSGARLQALQLGDDRVDVGQLVVSVGAASLLGDDVLLTHRMVLSASRGFLELGPMVLPPATRTVVHGHACHDAQNQAVPCIQVEPQPCAHAPPDQLHLTPTSRCFRLQVGLGMAANSVVVVRTFADNAPLGLRLIHTHTEPVYPGQNAFVSINPTGDVPAANDLQFSVQVRDAPR